MPESVFPWPSANPNVNLRAAQLKFTYDASSFSSNILRASTVEEVLFTTASHPLILEPQYLRVKTVHPAAANIYGLGEHSDAFRLNFSNVVRMPSRSHEPPRVLSTARSATHAVLLLSPSGMNVKRRNDESATTLEYNVINCVLDFYFLDCRETDTAEATRHYAHITDCLLRFRIDPLACTNANLCTHVSGLNTSQTWPWPSWEYDSDTVHGV